ncbi:MAG: dTMP kinase [Nitrosarchaeum sp.]|nr:dTMP kinase [Nitrosarchaeum sp.]
MFITFEGIDGCGKSTQLEIIAKILKDKGHDLLVTREPGGTRISEDIRKVLLSKDNSEMSNICELLLYLAARSQLVDEQIKPALTSGKIVLCDRFQESTFAYQSFARNVMSLSEMRKLNAIATNCLEPDLTIVFDIPVEESKKRRTNKNPDRLESNTDEFYEKARRAYFTLAEENPEKIIVVNGLLTVEKVTSLVERFVNQVISGDQISSGGIILPRKEMPVIPSLNDKAGWSYVCYSGVEIHLESDFKEGEDINDLPPIRTEHLPVGTKVITNVFGIWQKGVVSTDIGGLFVDAGPNVTNLIFDANRHCWTTSSAFNKAAITMVKVQS